MDTTTKQDALYKLMEEFLNGIKPKHPEEKEKKEEILKHNLEENEVILKRHLEEKEEPSTKRVCIDTTVNNILSDVIFRKNDAYYKDSLFIVNQKICNNLGWSSNVIQDNKQHLLSYINSSFFDDNMPMHLNYSKYVEIDIIRINHGDYKNKFSVRYLYYTSVSEYETNNIYLSSRFFGDNLTNYISQKFNVRQNFKVSIFTNTGERSINGYISRKFDKLHIDYIDRCHIIIEFIL